MNFLQSNQNQSGQMRKIIQEFEMKLHQRLLDPNDNDSKRLNDLQTLQDNLKKLLKLNYKQLPPQNFDSKKVEQKLISKN